MPDEQWEDQCGLDMATTLKKYTPNEVNEYRPITLSSNKNKKLLDNCYSTCIKTKDNVECKAECSNLKNGFKYPVFYTNPTDIPEYSGSSVANANHLVPQSEMATIIKDLDANLMGALITGNVNGKEMVLGKNYVYPMDYNMKVPFVGDNINADCIKPSGEKTTRNMFIRGIPKGDIAKYIGLNLNLPEQPIDWTKARPVSSGPGGTKATKTWDGLFKAIGGSTAVAPGKKKLEKALKKLKRKCKTFLYDVQTNPTSGDWSPVAKLKIPPECEQKFHDIVGPSTYKQIKDYDSSIFAGSLRGLIPSIVEDVVDLNPVSLARKSGLYSSETSAEQEKCKYITQQLGEQIYSDNSKLDSYTFEVFTNYSDDERIKIICMLIVVVVLFLFIF